MIKSAKPCSRDARSQIGSIAYDVTRATVPVGQFENQRISEVKAGRHVDRDGSQATTEFKMYQAFCIGESRM